MHKIINLKNKTILKIIFYSTVEFTHDVNLKYFEYHCNCASWNRQITTTLSEDRKRWVMIW